MQHRLLLVRHAEAAPGPVDIERPLTGRGLRQAAEIGSWLARAAAVPDRILVSPARRAVQTWQQAGAVLAAAPAPVVDPRIHDNTVEALMAAVRETPGTVRTLLVVGHNPSVWELTTALNDAPDRPQAVAGFPTGGVAVLDLAVPHAEVAPGTASLAAFAAPGG